MCAPPAAATAESNSHAASASSKRLHALDALRCLAVLLVLGCHGVLFYTLPNASDGSVLRLTYTASDPWPWPLAFFWNFGPQGVHLFFVLSGFLVSGLIFREHSRTGRFNVSHFLIRRGLKIYPSFYLMIVGSLLASIATGRLQSTANWAAEFLFVQNYWPGIWAHTWSLAVEEHFYILLSIGMCIALRRTNVRERPSEIIGLVAGAGVLCLIFRARACHMGAAWYQIEKLSHMRFDSLLFGVLLSYFHHHYPKHTSELVRVWRWPIVAYLLLVVATWVVVPRSHPLMSTIGLSALTLAFGGLTLLAVTSDIRPWVPLASLYRGCCRLGEYSYSIYLWHYPIQYVTGPAVRRILCTESAPPGLCYALYACGSVVVGIIMARLVEIPVLHLRDHWFPSRSGSLR